MIDIQNDLILICLKATWQDRGGDGKDGVKWHHNWQKIWGTSKFWQLIWFKKKKKAGKCELDSLRVCVYWHQAGHEVTEVQVGAARPHFSRQQSRWGVRSHVVHPSEHTHTSMSRPSECRREGRFVIYRRDVINSPVTNRHAIISISSL